MEQEAAGKGDVRFFPLAYMEAEIKQPHHLTVQVALKQLSYYASRTTTRGRAQPGEGVVRLY